MVGPFGARSSAQALYSSLSEKVGTSGRSRAQFSARAHSKPVPRGANIHLWVPAQK